MEAVTELRELRLRLMELETHVIGIYGWLMCRLASVWYTCMIEHWQNQVLSNQLKRQDDEIKTLVAKTEASERLDKEHQAKIKEHERKYADLEAKVCYIFCEWLADKRDQSFYSSSRWERIRCWLGFMTLNILSTLPNWVRKYLNSKWRFVFDCLFRIPPAFQPNNVNSWISSISGIPKNEQMLTEGELSMVEDSDRVRELQDRIGDLKAEVFFIDIAKFWLSSTWVMLKCDALWYYQYISSPL